MKSSHCHLQAIGIGAKDIFEVANTTCVRESLRQKHKLQMLKMLVQSTEDYLLINQHKYEKKLFENEDSQIDGGKGDTNRHAPLRERGRERENERQQSPRRASESEFDDRDLDRGKNRYPQDQRGPRGARENERHQQPRYPTEREFPEWDMGRAEHRFQHDLREPRENLPNPRDRPDYHPDPTFRRGREASPPRFGPGRQEPQPDKTRYDTYNRDPGADSCRCDYREYGETTPRWDDHVEPGRDRTRQDREYNRGHRREPWPERDQDHRPAHDKEFGYGQEDSVNDRRNFRSDKSYHTTYIGKVENILKGTHIDQRQQHQGEIKETQTVAARNLNSPYDFETQRGRKNQSQTSGNPNMSPPYTDDMKSRFKSKQSSHHVNKEPVAELKRVWPNRQQMGHVRNRLDADKDESVQREDSQQDRPVTQPYIHQRIGRSRVNELKSRFEESDDRRGQTDSVQSTLWMKHEESRRQGLNVHPSRQADRRTLPLTVEQEPSVEWKNSPSYEQYGRF